MAAWTHTNPAGTWVKWTHEGRAFMSFFDRLENSRLTRIS